MTIGVISDTHSLLIPPQVLKAFAKLDLIIHAGDLCDGGVLKQLGALAELRAVQGNMDDMALKKKLPMRDIITAQGVRIGVAHGHGPQREALLNAKAAFGDTEVDMVIFGHSHQAFHETIDGVIYFNPGSPNDTVRAPFCSYGLIKVKNGKIDAQIVKI